MVKRNSYLEAKKQKERQARDSEKRIYVPPAGREVIALEVVDGPQISPDEYLNDLEATGKRVKPWAYEVRRQKHNGCRPRPSSTLISCGNAPPLEIRRALLDKIAWLVDEHVFGRADMCLQFAALLERALQAIGLKATAKEGQVEYRRTSGNWMEWWHAWVELDDGTIVDGNADSIRENRVTGQGVNAKPFWGPRDDLPEDRRFPPGTQLALQHREDPDVVKIWWPDLENWMRQESLFQT